MAAMAENPRDSTRVNVPHTEQAVVPAPVLRKTDAPSPVIGNIERDPDYLNLGPLVILVINVVIGDFSVILIWSNLPYETFLP